MAACVILKKAAEFVRVIHRHTERLRALIEDLLDLGRGGAGRGAPSTCPDLAARRDEPGRGG